MSGSKRMGVVAGFPCLVCFGRPARLCWVELKARNGHERGAG